MRCQNCGSKDYSQRDKECSSCGYKDPDLRKVGEGELIFCSACACTYITDDGKCPTADHKGFVKKVVVKAGVKPDEK
jgi:hypothetical protein